MKEILPILMKDGYKTSHRDMYPPDTEEVYSNLTPRKGRDSGTGVVFFGLQYFLMEYLIGQYNENFFARPLAEVMAAYKRRIGAYLGPDAIKYDHIAELHAYGKLPVHIKAVPEGTVVPYGVPMLTIRNTQPQFFWVTNMLETIMSAILGQAVHVGDALHRFRQTFERYSRLTVSDALNPFIDWQGHDFSFRGMSGLQDACLSGAAHLLSFTGSDTIPAIDFLEQYYGADVDKELVSGSVPATEHSVMCMGLEAGERETFRRLIQDVYPAGIVSIVSDTWDFWQVITEILPSLKAEIMARPGKLVRRPDWGDPVEDHQRRPQRAARLTRMEGRHPLPGRDLRPHHDAQRLPRARFARRSHLRGQHQSRAARGHSLWTRCQRIRERQRRPGNRLVQLSIRDPRHPRFRGQGNLRPHHVCGDQAIFKCPKTDDGTKNSARGLLRVDRVHGKLVLRQDVSREEEAGGVLESVFHEGQLLRTQTLAGIREILRGERA